MALLKLNALNFRELENNSIEDIITNSAEDLKERIADYKKQGDVYDLESGTETFRQFYKHIGYYDAPRFEINSKNVTFKFIITINQGKAIYDEDVDYGNDLLTQEEINKCKSEDWQGEFPLITVYIVRLGNKEYSFYTISR